MAIDSNTDLETTVRALQRKVEEYERWFRFLDGQNRVLELERQKLRAILEGSGAGFAIVDDSLTVLWTNDVLRERYAEDAAEESLLGSSCRAILCRRSAPCADCPATAAFATGASAHHEFEIGPAGSSRCISASAIPIRSPFGSSPETLLMLEDVTDLPALQRARQAVRESDERYCATFDAVGVGIATLSPDGRFIRTNQLFQQFVGYSEEELLSLGFQDLTYPEDLEESLRVFERSIAEGWPTFTLDKRCLRKDGTHRWAHITAAWMRDDAGRPSCLIGFVQDITERRKTENALRGSEARLRVLVDHMPAVIWTIDQELRFTSCAGAGLAALGLEPNQLVGMSLHEYFSAEVSEFPAVAMHMRALLGDAVTYDMEWHGRTFQVRIDPLLGGDGAILGCIGAAHDITDRVRAEKALREAESALHERDEQDRHAQKMDAIGMLAGGVAHDFNNLLTGILGQAELLRTGAVPDEHVRGSVELIERAARRAAQLTKQLLGFARRGKHQNTHVDLHEVGREVISFLGRTVSKNIGIVESFSAPGPWVMGDPEQIQQVILNLGVNARDAMAQGGTLTIGTRAVRRSSEPPAEQDAIELFVQDTGCGIPEDVQGRVFDPFFTTKEQGRGTGMGLSMVYGIVKNHGGTVDFESEVGRGTVFRVVLPMALAPVEIAPSPAEEQAVTGQGRILLVDDEDVVREVARQYLQVLGYEVIAAVDGLEAVETYRRRGPEIDLVLIDMMMPRMDGRECFRELKRLNPEVRAVLSTGFGKNSAAQEILEEGMAGFVQKPYGIQQLSEVVARALHGMPATTPARILTGGGR